MNGARFGDLIKCAAIFASLLGMTNNAVSQTPAQCAVGRDILYFVDNSGSVKSDEYEQIRAAIRTSMSELKANANSGDRVAVVNWATASTSFIQTALNWTPVANLTSSQLSDVNFPCRSYGGSSGPRCGSTENPGGTNLQDAMYVLSVALTQSGANPAVGTIDRSNPSFPSIDVISPQSSRKLVIVNITDADGVFVSHPSDPVANAVFVTPPSSKSYLFSNILRGTEAARINDFKPVYQPSVGKLNATIVSVGFKPEDGVGLNQVLPFVSATSSISPNSSVGALQYDCTHANPVTTQLNDRTCSGPGGDGNSNLSSRRRLASYSDTIVADVIAGLIRNVLVETCPALSKSYTANPALISASGAEGTDVGGTITYTLRVENRNPQPITLVRLVDMIPMNTEFVSASDGGTLTTPPGGFPQVQWGPLSIPATTTLARSFTVRIPVDLGTGITEIVNEQYEALIQFDAESAPSRVVGDRKVTPIIRRSGSLTGSSSNTQVFNGTGFTLVRSFQITVNGQPTGDPVTCTTVPVPADAEYPRITVGTTNVEFNCTGIPTRQACSPACFVQVTRRPLAGLAFTPSPLQFFEGETVNVGVTATNEVAGYPVTYNLRYGAASQACTDIAGSVAPTVAGSYRVCASPQTTGTSANYSGSADAILTILPRVIINPVASATFGQSLTGISFSVTAGTSAVSNVQFSLSPPTGATVTALAPTAPCTNPVGNSDDSNCAPATAVPGVSCDRNARRCTIANLAANGSVPFFVGNRAAGTLVGTVVTLTVGSGPASSCRLTANSCDRIATQGEQ